MDSSCAREDARGIEALVGQMTNVQNARRWLRMSLQGGPDFTSAQASEHCRHDRNGHQIPHMK